MLWIRIRSAAWRIQNRIGIQGLPIRIQRRSWSGFEFISTKCKAKLNFFWKISIYCPKKILNYDTCDDDKTGTAVNKRKKNPIFDHVQNLRKRPDPELDRHQNGNAYPNRHQNDADPRHWIRIYYSVVHFWTEMPYRLVSLIRRPWGASNFPAIWYRIHWPHRIPVRVFLVRLLLRNNMELKLIHCLPGSVGFVPFAHK